MPDASCFALRSGTAAAAAAVVAAAVDAPTASFFLSPFLVLPLVMVGVMADLGSTAAALARMPRLGFELAFVVGAGFSIFRRLGGGLPLAVAVADVDDGADPGTVFRTLPCVPVFFCVSVLADLPEA